MVRGGKRPETDYRDSKESRTAAIKEGGPKPQKVCRGRPSSVSGDDVCRHHQGREQAALEEGTTALGVMEEAARQWPPRRSRSPTSKD
jgi:hypothetical protein